MAQQSKVRENLKELAEFVTNLELLIKGDDTYGSNVYVLSFEVADNGDISGRFEDAWNGRIFSYSVQKDRIGYKPALTLDRADSATAAKLFDIFSSGYTSLAIRQDAAKSGKKPRCTVVSYSCGKICLSLKNTCWINSAGQKVKKAGGAVASISQGRIDKLRVLARYLAANGNNKWSKYGGAELLAAKASNLETKRTNLFERNTINQSLNKLSAINPIQKEAPKIKEFKEPDNLSPQAIPALLTEPKTTASSKNQNTKADLSKGFIVSKQEIESIEKNIGLIYFSDKKGNHDTPPKTAIEYRITYGVDGNHLGYKGRLSGKNQKLTVDQIRRENSKETLADQGKVQAEKKERNLKHFNGLNDKLGGIGTTTTYGISIPAYTQTQEAKIEKARSELTKANIEHSGSWTDSNSSLTYQLRLSATEKNLKRIAEFIK